VVAIEEYGLLGPRMRSGMSRQLLNDIRGSQVGCFRVVLQG
jgi:hypothetical protein